MKLKKALSSALALGLVTVMSVPTVFAATATPASTNRYIKGDVDLDGKVTSADSLKIQRYVCKKETFTAIQKYLADVNFDGKVTEADSEVVLQYSVGIKDTSNNEAGKVVSFVKSLSFSSATYYNNPFKFSNGASTTIKPKLTVNPTGNCETINYTLSNPNVASIDSKTGEVKFYPGFTGRVSVTAKSSITGKSASCQVVVSDFFDSLYFSFSNHDARVASDNVYKKANKDADICYWRVQDYGMFTPNEASRLAEKTKIGGCCFGMSMFPCLLNSPKSGLKIMDFYHAGNKVTDIRKLELTDIYKGSVDIFKNKNVREIVAMLHMTRDSNIFPEAWDKTDTDDGKNDDVYVYNEMIEAVSKVETTKEPVICGYGGGHGVVGYKVVEATVKENDIENKYSQKNMVGKKVKRLYYNDSNDRYNKNKFISFFIDNGNNGKITNWCCTVNSETTYCSDAKYFNGDKTVSNHTFESGKHCDYVTSEYYLKVWELGKQRKLVNK